MIDCIFCKIVSGEAPCYKIYEDANFLAFLDIYPFGAGHTLVIPKLHLAHIWDLKDPGIIFNVTAKLINHYRHSLKVETCYTFVFEESVPHAHLQILPATSDNKQRLFKAISTIRQPQLDPQVAADLQSKLQLS